MMLSLMRKDDAVQDNLSPPIRKYRLGWLGRGGYQVRRPSHNHIAALAQITRQKMAELGRNGFIGLAGFDMSRETSALEPVGPLCLVSSGRRDWNRPAPPEPHKHRAEQFPIPHHSQPNPT